MPVFVDTHCHYEGYWTDSVFSSLIKEARNNGLRDALVCPRDAEHMPELISFCRKFGLSFALGVHPFEWEEKVRYLDLWSDMIAQYKDKCAAVGEIGLDFSAQRLAQWAGYEKEFILQEQTDLFEAQLSFAGETGLPASVHAFGALPQVLTSIKRIYPRSEGHRGVIHAFNGSLEQAREFLKLGFKLGFGGTLTYEGSKKIRRVFAALGDSDWVLETDAPWIPSTERRTLAMQSGETNPMSIPADELQTIRTAAVLRGTSENEICRMALTNTADAFPKLRTMDSVRQA